MFGGSAAATIESGVTFEHVTLEVVSTCTCEESTNE